MDSSLPTHNNILAMNMKLQEHLVWYDKMYLV